MSHAALELAQARSAVNQHACKGTRHCGHPFNIDVNIFGTLYNECHLRNLSRPT